VANWREIMDGAREQHRDTSISELMAARETAVDATYELGQSARMALEGGDFDAHGSAREAGMETGVELTSLNSLIAERQLEQAEIDTQPDTDIDFS
jgi:hypothetical protein